MPPKGKAPAKPDASKAAAAKSKLEETKQKTREAVGVRRQGSMQLRENWAKQAPPKRKPVSAKGKGKGGKGKGKGKGRDKAVAALEKKLEWKRRESIKEEWPPKLRKPKFGKVKSLNPESKGINVMVKCVSIAEVAGTETKFWDAVCGDETGVVTFRLKEQAHVDVCKAGASLRVQNARVQMVSSGFVRVIVDKWGVMKAADSALEFEVNSSKDISATEYEQVQS